MVMFMVVPIATAPPTTVQQADSQFSAKNKVVNERIFSGKTDYDKILSQTKFNLPIDTVMKAGDWDLGLTLDSAGRVLKSFIGRDFSFGNRTEALTTSTWGPNEVAWLGSREDANSIKGKVKAIETDGNLSLVFTADAWDSKVRTIILENGKQPQFIYNNGVKDTSDKGCIVEFSNVQKNGDDISLTMRLVKDYTSQGGMTADEKNPLFFPPNFNFWLLVEASGPAQVQNWLSGRVVADTTVKVTKGNYPNYSYANEKMKNILLVNIVNNHKYLVTEYAAWARYVYRSGAYDGQVSGAIYGLGMKNNNGKYSLPKSYAKFVGVAQDSDAYTLDPNNATQIALGGAPSSKADVFGSLQAANERARYFTIQTGNNTWNEGNGAVMMFISRDMNDTTAPYSLNNGVLDSGKVIQKSGAWNLTREKQATEFLIDFNMRVRVINPQHIVIEDISPEAMAGQKYAIPVVNSVPYKKSSDTTDVIDPIARSSVLKVYPNPASDQLTVEVSGQGRTWVNLTDLYGRVVKNVYNGPVEGIESFPLSTGELPSGVYFLQVRGTNKAEAIKVEIIH
jgi:hypothetical protein